jgi:hypothetical protein
VVGLSQKSDAILNETGIISNIPFIGVGSTLLPVIALEFPPNTPYVLLNPILIGRDANVLLLNNTTFPVQTPLEKFQGFDKRWDTVLGRLRIGASGVTGIAYDVMPMPVVTYR